MFHSLIQISRSRVGRTPPNISSFSMVRTSQSQMLFMIISRMSVVFLMGVTPASLSSSLQADLNIRAPSTSLQPSLIAWSHSLMSSMYRAPDTSLMPIPWMASISMSSHQHITNLATQHVERRPIGPPFNCKKNLELKE